MSNIGKQRIFIPKNVDVYCVGWKICASSKYGNAHITFPHHTKLIIEDNYLRVVAPQLHPSLYGSLQKRLKSLIHGLSLQYVTYLQFVGVGYRARIEDNLIILRLGFSHEINVTIPENLKVSVVKRNTVRIAGPNFEIVQQFAYKLRSFRPPEPFKGKGIIILGEIVRRKEGKKKKI